MYLRVIKTKLLLVYTQSSNGREHGELLWQACAKVENEHSSQEKIGTNHFVLTVQINEELIRTLLGFMGELQIISPAHLVQTWNERIQKQLSIETHGNIL